MKADLLSMFPEELSELCIELGQPKYRGMQIFEGLYKGARDINDFTALPKAFRERLEENAFIPCARIKRKLVSAIDGTVKYLYELHDGETVESVFMRYHHGNTMCIRHRWAAEWAVLSVPARRQGLYARFTHRKCFCRFWNASAIWASGFRILF